MPPSTVSAFPPSVQPEVSLSYPRPPKLRFHVLRVAPGGQVPITDSTDPSGAPTPLLPAVQLLSHHPATSSCPVSRSDVAVTGLRFLSFLLAAQPGTQPDTRGSIQLQHEARSPGCTPARTGHTGFLSYVQHGGQMTSHLCCPLPERWLCPSSWAACGLLAQIPDSVMKGNLHHPLLFVLSTVTLSPPCHPGWHWGHKSQLLTRERQALNVLL